MCLTRIFRKLFNRRRRPKARRIEEKVITASGYIEAPSNECMSARIRQRRREIE